MGVRSIDGVAGITFILGPQASSSSQLRGLGPSRLSSIEVFGATGIMGIFGLRSTLAAVFGVFLGIMGIFEQVRSTLAVDFGVSLGIMGIVGQVRSTMGLVFVGVSLVDLVGTTCVSSIRVSAFGVSLLQAITSFSVSIGMVVKST